VRVTAGSGGTSVGLVDAGGVLEIAFAAGEWVLGTPREVPLAASGGWTPEGDLEVEVMFLESPHTLRVRCAAASGRATVDWATTPLHSVAPSEQRHP
jgi:hypothetical protein